MPDIKVVHDRKLPTEIPADQMESQRRGSVGKGLNEQDYCESQADFASGYCDEAEEYEEK